VPAHDVHGSPDGPVEAGPRPVDRDGTGIRTNLPRGWQSRGWQSRGWQSRGWQSRGRQYGFAPVGHPESLP
jgi:hypothetical protein